MKCPIDGETLVMTDRSGVEIDYCPKCRGVWLDRGELDKIIERAAPAPAHAPRGETPRAEASRDDYRPRQVLDDRYEKPRYKKRESFLSDLFDF
jgi:hypothetical protein